jgi:hypothetical protein
MAEANGAPLFSVGGFIYKRIDGPKPTYARNPEPWRQDQYRRGHPSVIPEYPRFR